MPFPETSSSQGTNEDNLQQINKPPVRFFDLVFFQQRSDDVVFLFCFFLCVGFCFVCLFCFCFLNNCWIVSNSTMGCKKCSQLLFIKNNILV